MTTQLRNINGSMKANHQVAKTILPRKTNAITKSLCMMTQVCVKLEGHHRNVPNSKETPANAYKQAEEKYCSALLTVNRNTPIVKLNLNIPGEL